MYNVADGYLDFSLQKIELSEGKQYPCVLIRHALQVFSREKDGNEFIQRFEVKPGDVLYKTDKTYSIVSHNRATGKIGKIPNNAAKEFYENWTKHAWKDYNIQGQDKLISLIAFAKSNQSIAERYTEVIIKDETGLDLNLDNISLKELNALREQRLKIWNKIYKNFSDEFSLSILRTEVLKNIISDQIVLNRKSMEFLIKEIESLSLELHNRNRKSTFQKILYDYVDEKFKGQSDKKISLKILKLKEKHEVLKWETIELDNIFIKKELNFNKVKDFISSELEANYKIKIENIIEGFHPKFHVFIINLAKELEFIEEKINIRLQAYVFDNYIFNKANKELDFSLKM